MVCLPRRSIMFYIYKIVSMSAVLSAFYSVQCIHVYCTLYTIHCTVYTVYYTVYSVQCRVYIELHSLNAVEIM